MIVYVLFLWQLQIFKFSSLRKKSFSQNPSAGSSVVGTPEIEARDFRQDLLDGSAQNNGSFWGRTFGQAFSWMNKTNNQPVEENSFNNSMNHPTGANGSIGVSLNAYLTYVTLKLPLIMQGNCWKLNYLDLN